VELDRLLGPVMKKSDSITTTMIVKKENDEDKDDEVVDIETTQFTANNTAKRTQSRQ
jgi:hypothetical protein